MNAAVSQAELPAAPPAHPRWLVPSLAALAVLITLVAYRGSFQGKNVYDGIILLGLDPSYQEVTAVRKSATFPGASRILGRLTFALNYAFSEGGKNFWGYHAVNLAVHLAAGLFLFGLVFETLARPGWSEVVRRRAPWIAFAIASIWLVHPLNTESVTYLIQRFESLKGMFCFLGLYLLARGARDGASRLWYAGAVGALILGVNCKEDLAFFPALALAYDRVFLASSWREIWRRRKWAQLALLAVSLLSIYNTSALLHVEQVASESKGGLVSVGFGVREVTWWTYLASQPAVLLHYFKLAVWPDPLCLDYGWPVSESVLQIYGLGAVIVVLLGLAIYGIWHGKTWGFLLGMFFLALGPTSSFIPLRDLAVEHRMYVPLAAIVAAAVGTALVLSERFLQEENARAFFCLGGLGLVLLGASLGTHRRNLDYQNPLVLWTKVTEVAPRNSRAWNCLAVEYQNRGQFDLAADAAFNYMDIGGRPEHVRYYAYLLGEAGRHAEAEAQYRRLIEKSPDFSRGFHDYGNWLAGQKRYGEAIDRYRQALKLNDKNNSTYWRLGVAQYESGDTAGALDTLNRALKVNPKSSEAVLRKAWILATASESNHRDGPLALKLVDGVTDRFPERYFLVQDVRAAALAECGRFAEAALEAEKAIAEAESQKSPQAEAIRKRSALYQQQLPYRHAPQPKAS